MATSHIQLIDALEDAENKEEADKIISELKASFEPITAISNEYKTIHTSDKEVSAKALFKGDIGSATAIQLQRKWSFKRTYQKPCTFCCALWEK